MKLLGICKIKNCNKEEYSRGFCPEHSNSIYYKPQVNKKKLKYIQYSCFEKNCKNPVISLYKKFNIGVCKIHNTTKIKMKICRQEDKYQLNEKEYRRRKSQRKQKEKYKHQLIAQNLRARINNALRKTLNKKPVGCSAIKDLGCTIQEFIQYLESKFKIGMNWNNYGFKGWHVDHVKPLCKFNLTNSEEYKQAAHYTNLQPLWWNENFSKNGR